MLGCVKLIKIIILQLQISSFVQVQQSRVYIHFLNKKLTALFVKCIWKIHWTLIGVIETNLSNRSIICWRVDNYLGRRDRPRRSGRAVRRPVVGAFKFLLQLFFCDSFYMQVKVSQFPRLKYHVKNFVNKGEIICSYKITVIRRLIQCKYFLSNIFTKFQSDHMLWLMKSNI